MSDGSQKVPSQIFRWFEKMKSNYESSIESVLNRFEAYNSKQQLRLDTANKDHIDSLKHAHNLQLEQSQSTISQLHHDIAYYKEQIARQQNTIEQLNTRYDAVMACLLTEKNKNINVKDIFDNDDFFAVENTKLPTPNSKNAEDCASESFASNNDMEAEEIDEINNENDTFVDIASHTNAELHVDNNDNDVDKSPVDYDQLFSQAIDLRENGEFISAFNLFQQGAENNHAKAMGAMGRSYFLGEGVEEDHTLGLMWLIKAAKLNLPQAITRVEHIKSNDPDLYQKAKALIGNSIE